MFPPSPFAKEATTSNLQGVFLIVLLPQNIPKKKVKQKKKKAKGKTWHGLGLTSLGSTRMVDPDPLYKHYRSLPMMDGLGYTGHTIPHF